MVGYMSLNLGVTVAGGYFLGHALENAYHWENMTLIGILTGLILGLFEVFILAYKAGIKK